jgi:hypothetical protein
MFFIFAPPSVRHLHRSLLSTGIGSFLGGSERGQVDGFGQSAAGVTSFLHHTGLTFPLGHQLEILLEAELSAA